MNADLRVAVPRDLGAGLDVDVLLQAISGRVQGADLATPSGSEPLALETRVLREGQRLRIYATLCGHHSREVRWVHRYDASLADPGDWPAVATAAAESICAALPQ